MKLKKFSNDIDDFILSSRLTFIRKLENFKAIEPDQKVSQKAFNLEALNQMKQKKRVPGRSPSIDQGNIAMFGNSKP